MEDAPPKIPNYVNEKDIQLIIKVLRSFFINVHRLIFSLDQVEADNFKRKNQYYYELAL